MLCAAVIEMLTNKKIQLSLYALIGECYAKSHFVA